MQQHLPAISPIFFFSFVFPKMQKRYLQIRVKKSETYVEWQLEWSALEWQKYTNQIKVALWRIEEKKCSSGSRKKKKKPLWKMWRKCRAYQSYGDGFSALKWTNTMNDSQVNILAFQHFEPSDPNAHAVNMWAMTLTSDQIWGNIYDFFRFEFLDQKISTHSVLCEMFAILKNLLEI